MNRHESRISAVIVSLLWTSIIAVSLLLIGIFAFSPKRKLLQTPDNTLLPELTGLNQENFSIATFTVPGVVPENTLIPTLNFPTQSASLVPTSENDRIRGTDIPPIQTKDVLSSVVPTTDIWIESALANLSLEQRLGQLILSGVSGQNMTSTQCDRLQGYSFGGVIYRAGNVSDREQLSSYSHALQECAQEAGLPALLIAIDHEGQYVNRFDRGMTIFPSAMARGALLDLELNYWIAMAEGQELASAGVNMVLAPVADLLTAYDSTVISVRSFGEDPDKVAEIMKFITLGYKDAGILGVLKHFPGHGGVAQDSHEILPVDSASLSELQSHHLIPFISGIENGAQVVMLSHVVFPGLDGDQQPASLSEPVIRLLRQNLGFQGVILTDSIGMGGIKQNWDVGEAGWRAIKAGADMVLCSSDETANAVSARLKQAFASGEFSEEQLNASVRRILGLKKNLLAKITEPEWNANRNLAFSAGYNSVAVLRDLDNLIPLVANSRVLVVAPPQAWGLQETLTEAFTSKNISFKLINYSAPWEGPIVDSGIASLIFAQSGGFDLILFFTWDAHLNFIRYKDNWQSEVIRTLQDDGLPLIVVALKSPTDLLEFPQVSTFMASFGTTSGQIQALGDILIGKTPALGQNPLINLP